MILNSLPLKAPEANKHTKCFTFEGIHGEGVLRQLGFGQVQTLQVGEFCEGRVRDGGNISLSVGEV